MLSVEKRVLKHLERRLLQINEMTPPPPKRLRKRTPTVFYQQAKADITRMKYELLTVLDVQLLVGFLKEECSYMEDYRKENPIPGTSTSSAPCSTETLEAGPAGRSNIIAPMVTNTRVSPKDEINVKHVVDQLNLNSDESSGSTSSGNLRFLTDMEFLNRMEVPLEEDEIAIRSDPTIPSDNKKRMVTIVLKLVEFYEETADEVSFLRLLSQLQMIWPELVGSTYVMYSDVSEGQEKAAEQQ